MANNELVIEPKKLMFNGPFTRTVIVEIRLHNPTAQVIAFKIKTIEPARYRVKPSKEIIAHEQSVTVAVHMRPLENEGKVEHFITNKQKFLVQWVACENSVGKTVAELLDNPQVHEAKLECEFDAQPNQSLEKSDSYKSVMSVGTPELGDQSDGTDSGIQTPAATSPSSQWLSRPRLVVALLSALALFCAIFLTYYKLAHTNSDANN